MQPFFSIRTATYNRASLLKRVFKSLKEQTFQNFEWIILDDGSTDNTEKVIKEFKKENLFPIIYIKKQHAGKHMVINDLGKYMKGRYFFPLDSDDTLYDKHVLKNIYDKIEKLPKDKIFWGICGLFIDQNNCIIGNMEEDFFDIDQRKFIEYYVTNPGKMNLFWVTNTKYWHPYDFSHVVDELSFYPECVTTLNSVLHNPTYQYRVFNLLCVRYYRDTEDSVSKYAKKTMATWYQLIDEINLFSFYGLVHKYPKFFKNKLKMLSRFSHKNCSLSKTLNALKEEHVKKVFLRLFYINRCLKYLFYIENNPERIKCFLFGIKIYSRKRKKV